MKEWIGYPEDVIIVEKVDELYENVSPTFITFVAFSIAATLCLDPWPYY